MRQSRTTFARLIIALVTSFGLAASAAGAQVTYLASDDPKGTVTNSKAKQAEFLATLSSFGTDNLESYANNTLDPKLSFGATGVTAQTDVNAVVTFGLFAISGTNIILDQGPAKATDPGIPDVLTFSKNITAFGFFASNVGDSTNVNTFTLKLENTTLATSKNVVFGPFGPGRASGAVLYLGVTDTDPFNRVTISESMDFDGTLWDDITAGYVIPEPGTFALLAIGSVLAAFAGRFRRK